MDKKLTITDKEIEDLAKAIEEELGLNVIAYGTAKDLLKLMEEKKFSKKVKEESK